MRLSQGGHDEESYRGAIGIAAPGGASIVCAHMERTGVRRPVALGVAWLLWIWGVATASAYFLSDASGARGWPPCVTQRVTPLTRWDSGWYLSIAESGYELPPSVRHQNTNHAFFPLYPLLMRLV